MSKTKYIALKLRKNYADEFDVWSTEICTAVEWEQAKTDLLSYADKIGEMSYSFGTNEVLEWNDVEDFISSITVIPIPIKFVPVAESLSCGPIDILDIVRMRIYDIKANEATAAFNLLPEEDRNEYAGLIAAVKESTSDIFCIERMLQHSLGLSWPEVNAVQYGDPQSELWQLRIDAIDKAQKWWSEHGLWGDYQSLSIL